jgi:hypothetical protein
MPNQSDTEKTSSGFLGVSWRTWGLIILVTLVYSFISNWCNNKKASEISITGVNYRASILGEYGTIIYYMTINGDDSYTIEKEYFDAVSGRRSNESWSGKVVRGFKDEKYQKWKLTNWKVLENLDDACMIFIPPDRGFPLSSFEVDPSCSEGNRTGRVIRFKRE